GPHLRTPAAGGESRPSRPTGARRALVAPSAPRSRVHQVRYSGVAASSPPQLSLRVSVTVLRPGANRPVRFRGPSRPLRTRPLPEKSWVNVAFLPSACVTTIFSTASTKNWPVPLENCDRVTVAPLVWTLRAVDWKKISPGLTTGWLAHPPVRPSTPPTLP